MGGVLVFRGQWASAEVVAGYLRQQHIPLVEVIPPTPYLAGPLRLAYVRVPDDQAETADDLVTNPPHVTKALNARAFRPWVRGVAAFVLLLDALPGLMTALAS